MLVRVPRPVAACCCGLATLVLFASETDAQTRRAVPRPAGRRVAATPVRAVYFRGYGYRPYYLGFYDPFLYRQYPYPYYGTRYDQGAVRLEVKPETTEVYVDGYYAGVVDSFDGIFQRLRLPAGKHKVTLYLEGYESTRETLYLVAGETYRIRHQMEPLVDGAPQPIRPEPTRDPKPECYPAERGALSPELPLRAEQFGTLAIRVQPTDAEVRIDGEVWRGFEGLEHLVVELGAGWHVVEVSWDGYRSYRTDIEITESDPTLLNISLPDADENC